MAFLLAVAALGLLAGSLVYCVLTVLAAARYRAVRPPALSREEPISVIKPLHGIDEGLRENLLSFFRQDYHRFEILMAVRTEADPAVPLVRELQAAHPHVPSRLLFTGQPPYANAKVHALEQMCSAAEHDLMVMADSDVRVGSDFLRVLAAEFQHPRVGVATCPYRAAPGRSIWSKLEALGMNTEFLGGVLVARMLEGMKFALGPTIAARKQAIADAGGWQELSAFLAEDFVLGNRAAERGHGVILSSYVIEHRIGSEPWKNNAIHRIRWNRSTRRSRPAGYVGQLFTNPLPLAVLVWGLRPEWWLVLPVTLVFRAASAWATAGFVLRDPLTARLWPLLPAQDFLSFAFWVAGFFGNTILWRGRRYLLKKDGTFEFVGQ